MKKLGIGLPNLGANQMAYLSIININKYLAENHDVDIIAFYENSIKQSIVPNFSCMPSIELWGYDAPVVACSLNMAEDIIKIPTISSKYFYVYDLEWVHLIDKEFFRLNDVYSNPYLELIARCKDHAKIISQCWNRPVKYIVEDFDIKQLVDIAWNKN